MRVDIRRMDAALGRIDPRCLSSLSLRVQIKRQILGKGFDGLSSAFLTILKIREPRHAGSVTTHSWCKPGKIMSSHTSCRPRPSSAMDRHRGLKLGRSTGCWKPCSEQSGAVKDGVDEKGF